MDRSFPSAARWGGLLVVLLVVGVTLAGGTVTAQDEFEPNDDRDEAEQISEGTYEGLDITDGESDFYAIELDEGERIDASITFDDSEGNLNLHLHHGSVNVAASWSMADDEESVSYTAPEAGTYYVEASGANGWISNTYDLEIDLESGQADGDDGDTSDQFEPNDVAEEAAELEPGSYEDLSVSSTDSDYYAVDVEAGERLNASIEFAHAEGDLDLALYDGDGENLIVVNSWENQERVWHDSEDGGTYVVRVFGYDNAANDYSLDVDVWDPDDDSQEGSSEETTDNGSEETDDSGDSTAESTEGSTDGDSGESSEESTTDDDGDDGDDGLPGFGVAAALVGLLAALAIASRRGRQRGN